MKLPVRRPLQCPRSIVVCLVAASVAAVSGCGEGVKDPEWPNPVPFTGTVTYGNAPLADAVVMFVPDTTTTGQGGSGETDQSGNFKIQSRAANGQMQDGIIPGRYKVAFSRVVMPDGKVWRASEHPDEGPATLGGREELPLKYSLPSESTFVVDVGANGGSQDFKLDK